MSFQYLLKDNILKNPTVGYRHTYVYLYTIRAEPALHRKASDTQEVGWKHLNMACFAVSLSVMKGSLPNHLDSTNKF